MNLGWYSWIGGEPKGKSWLTAEPSGEGAHGAAGLAGFELVDEEHATGGGQGHDEFVVALEALSGVFGEGGDDGVAGGLADFVDHVVGRGDGGMDMGGDDFVDGGCFKGDVAGDGVVEGAGEAIHVREKVLAFLADFFGSDIVGGAPDTGIVVVFGIGAAGEAEVDEFGFTFGVEEDVTGFDIAVEEFVFEGEVEGGGDFDADIEDVEFWDAAFVFDAAVEGASVGEFHDEVAEAAPFIERIDVDDIGMV